MTIPLSRYILPAAAAVTLFLCGSAQAVRISAQREGQALIFPYYTVAAGNSTALSLSNYSDRGKVVQLRVAEGENGRTVLTLNIYLGQYDNWSATLFDSGDGAALLTEDRSCTFPPLRESTALPQLPDGRRYVRLELHETDAGSSGAARLREGFIEAVEVASVRPGTQTFNAINGPFGPRDCGVVNRNWTAPDGRWITDPLADMANATGSLGGELMIVNVVKGTVFAASPIALEEYRVDPLDAPRGTLASVAQHRRDNGPGSLLAQALTDPAAGAAAADVIIDGRARRLTYAAPERAIDAVSAVFMATDLRGPLEEVPELGARSSYVLTYPTRRFYTDSSSSGLATPLPPFGAMFAGVRPLAQSPGYRVRHSDRDGSLMLAGSCLGFGGCPGLIIARLPGTTVELLAPGGAPDPLLGTRLHGDIGYDRTDISFPVRGSGWLGVSTVDAANRMPGEPLRASREGWRLLGLPVIGTRLANYVNANVSPGVLANYSFAVPMTTQMRCIDASGNSCP